MIAEIPQRKYGGATDVQITSPTVMTHGVLRFDYTVSLTGDAGDLTGDDNPQSGLEPGHTISFNYQNHSDTVQSVYYHILPRTEGTGCAAGPVNTAEVKVHPRPLQDIIITTPLTCDSNSDLALRAILAKGTDPYTIDWFGPFSFSAHNETDVSGLPGGLYTVEVTDSLGCYYSSTIESTKASPGFIFYSPDKEPYNIANTSCYDTGDGELFVAYTDGEDPPYSVKVVKNETDTIFEDILTDNVISDTSAYFMLQDIDYGDYELIVMDANGCFYYKTTRVTRPDPITATYELSDHAGYNISCKGYSDGEISVTDVSGGNFPGISGDNGDYKYMWYTFDGSIPGDNTLDHITNVPAGTYYLQISDTLGCTMVDSVTLTEPEGITLLNTELSTSADGDYNISCYGGSDGYIILNFQGGSGVYTYNWTGPENSGLIMDEKNQTGLIAGDYNVIVTDVSGCSMDFDFTLTEPDSLELLMEPSLTPDGKYNIHCNGGTGDIDITVSGGSAAGYSYEWTGPEGSGLDSYAEDQSGLIAGKYIVEVSDFNGCIITDSITLTEPPAMTVDLSATDITCESPGMNNGSITSTVQGGEEPYSYSWSNGAGTEDISGLTEGRYYLTVTDIYGCQVIDSSDIALPPPLEFNKALSDYNGFNISCYNEDDGYIDLSMTSGEEPYIFNWAGPDGFSSTKDSIGRLSAGEYILTVEDNNYCIITDTTVITQPGQLTMELEISESDYGGFNVNCYGDNTASIEIIPENNVGEVGYNWTDGYSQRERTGLAAGTYGVLIADENSCSVDTVITLTQPEPVSFTAEVVQPYCEDKPDGEISIEAMGGYVISDYSYLWFDNSTSSYKDNVAAGEYWLTVTDDNGCSVTDTIIVTSERDNCLTIPNAISPNGDNINDVWNIDLIELYPEAEIRIFNRWGEMVWVSEKGYPQPWDGTSNGRRLPIDTYHYIINLHDGSKPAIGGITILR
ncbi:MAG: gliding motility-associated C-terminal domain-containing protein [Bacteroidales bacterium]|nr:gliding motility-associated C-terminal domain-containing protein [Bacteroidales bacterium]